MLYLSDHECQEKLNVDVCIGVVKSQQSRVCFFRQFTVTIFKGALSNKGLTQWQYNSQKVSSQHYYFFGSDDVQRGIDKMLTLLHCST